ncbi:MAG: hypothetical protein ACI37O_00765 [Candidatus Avelusimicrobium sp.]|uniref:hypothetical protein n=1 Tax=Candidatus Avelusimicrobium sp. TaxID=3048833 RepID=UPI003EFEF92F
MKKLASFLAGLLLAFAPVFCTAQGLVPYRLVRPLTSVFTRQVSLVSQRAWISPLMFPARYLPAGLQSYPALRGAMDAKVSQRVFTANPNQLVDLHKLPLQPAQTFEIIRNLKSAPPLQQADLFLNVFPYLNISRNAPATETDRLTALNHYRKVLLTALKHPAPTPNAWGRAMAAVSNLGLYGTATDGLLIFHAAQSQPKEFTVYTDVISARALLCAEDYQHLQELAELRTATGRLPAHWKGIVQYAKEKGLPVKFPPVKTAARAETMPKALQASLEKWNPLNLYHTHLSAEDTYNWLALRKTAEENILPSETAAVQAPGETAPAPQTPTAPKASAALRHQFFEDSTGRPGPLGIFCQTQNIDYTGKTLGDVLTLISASPSLRSKFVSMVKNNSSDIVYRLIKGLSPADYQALKRVYPAENDAEEFSPRLGEDVLNLLYAVTASPQAQKIGELLNKGYLFISHFRGTRIFLGTEFNSAEIPALAQHIKDFNRANGIGRAEFAETFSPSAGQTAAVTTNPQAKIDPNRIFIFENGSEVRFAELPAFLREHPNTLLKSSNYRQTQDVTYTNTKTHETFTKPGVTKLRQESLDEELRSLENLLRGEETRAVLLLNGQTAEENFRFMFERMQDLTPALKAHLRQLLGQEEFTLSYRFGEHEIEGRGNLIPLANMHMHLEAYIPALNFTYNLSIPLRASEAAKADILTKFQEWEAGGKPEGSPIKYYGAPSFWEKLSPKNLRFLPESTASNPAAEYSEMYEGDFSLGFAF